VPAPGVAENPRQIVLSRPRDVHFPFIRHP
jgi:hypothetical protein